MNAVEQLSVQPDQVPTARKPWAAPTVTADSARSTRALANNLGADMTNTIYGSTYGS